MFEKESLKMPMVRMLLGVALAMLITMPTASAAPALEREQALVDQEFELNGVDATNTVNVDLDAAIVQTDPAGHNEQQPAGANLQENHSLQAPTADAVLLQTLISNDFNRETAEMFATMYNSVNLEVDASEELTANVGINAAAGVFNLQMNASVMAPAATDTLAQSSADLGQQGQFNYSVLQDVTNEVTTSIVLDDVAVNVGINSVAGVGNELMNSVTIMRPF
jgi:hypothetical protein